MDKILVSVIVPVYNVEKYIERTITSIKEQDYENIEIIIVDDGSPDRSSQIVDEISKSDTRIKVIHKKNGGVSSARNAGLKIANGEYVTFVDGDDWIDPNYVSYYVTLIEKYQCEMIFNKNNYSEKCKYSGNKCVIIRPEKAMEWIYTGKIFVAVWNKIYKTSFLKKYRIAFDETIWYGEGMLFNIDCLQYVDKVVVCEKCVYHQTANPDSAMRKFNLKSNLCGIKSLEVQKRHWKKENERVEKAWEYHRRAFNWSIMSGIARAGVEEKYLDIFNECACNLKKKLWVSLRVNIPIKEKLLYVLLAINPYAMAKREKRKASSNGKKK